MYFLVWKSLPFLAEMEETFGSFTVEFKARKKTQQNTFLITKNSVGIELAQRSSYRTVKRADNCYHVFLQRTWAQIKCQKGGLVSKRSVSKFFNWLNAYCAAKSMIVSDTFSETGRLALCIYTLSWAYSLFSYWTFLTLFIHFLYVVTLSSILLYFSLLPWSHKLSSSNRKKLFEKNTRVRQ